MERNIYKIGKELFITSEEEIRKNDWVLFKFNEATEIVRVTIINNNAFETKQGFGYGLEYCKKIILTTDQDLIADGIQAIDDGFLKWFVKNLSCEEVEITKGKMKLNDDGEEYGFPDMSLYKIIIPKEEQKKILIDIMQDDEELGLYDEPKQRLEKYSERFDNKENEIVEGIFNPETWGKRLVEEPEQFFSDDRVKTLEKSIEYLLKRQERMYSDLSELRNDLYDKLPIGDVDAFEILKVIKNHLQKLDVLCGNK